MYAWNLAYILLVGSTSTCMCKCTAVCGMGTMRQPIHLDHDDKIIGLNISTNIDKEQFLSRM